MRASLLQKFELRIPDPGRLNISMLRTIDRYLIREVTLSWLAVTLVLWSVAVVNRLARYLAQAAAGDLPGPVIFSLLGLKSVNYLVTLTPFAFFLGVLLALGRWSRDHEIMALAAGGMGPREIYRPLLLLAVALGLVLIVASFIVSPFAARAGYAMQAKAEAATDMASIVAGRFIEARNGQLIFYAESASAEHDRLDNVFARTTLNDEKTLITARHARLRKNTDTGTTLLEFENGVRYQGRPGDAEYRIMQFGKHGLRISGPDEVQGEAKRDSMPFTAIWNSNDPKDIAELQWRVSVPLSVITLAFLAVPLIRSASEKSRYAHLLIAVLIFIIYFNLLKTAQVWIERDDIPAWVGMWWVHALPVVSGVLLFRWQQPRAGSGTGPAQ